MMAKLFSTTPGLWAFSVAVLSSIGLVSATPANGLTFKATIYNSPEFSYYNAPPYNFNGFELYYTLADDLFDTVVSSPLDTFFTERYNYYEPLGTVIPEVVTEFKTGWAGTEPMERSFGRSIFGIEGERSSWNYSESFNVEGSALFIHILDSDLPKIYSNIFHAVIKAPEGLPLSACKTQVCEGFATLSYKRRYSNLPLIHTPVTDAQPVPEPSAAIALGLVSALLLNRQRKTSHAQSVATADNP